MQCEQPRQQRELVRGRWHWFRVSLVGSVVLAGWTNTAAAQPNLGSAFPNPRLFSVTPPGGQAGKVVEVTFTGTDLEEPKGLWFSHPAIKLEPIIPPVPPAPPADAKKPAPPPPPAPPITKFRVTIPAEVAVGIYDVRLIGKWGVSNPRAFVVGDLAEVLEKEPNNEVDQAQRVEMNSTINGVIAAATDVDYYVFAGKKGQRVLAVCLASSIDSRLHPALELFNAQGRQLAADRRYQETDALLDVTLPADGDYYVRLHEFTYTQGSPEHFYRLSITTAPWIDAMFPPVVEPGKPAQVTVYGRNLPGGQPDATARVHGKILEKLVVTVNPPGDTAALQRLAYSGRVSPVVSATDGFEYRLRNPAGASNPFLLTYARVPVVLDNGANNRMETAQEVSLPCEIAGRIEKKRERDWYVFTAKKDAVYSIEVFSERLGAQADMYFTLRNTANNQVLADLDDNTETLAPLKFFTRNDDPPRFRFVAPTDGKYQLMVSSRDADTRAGPRQFYRMRIAPEAPDFRLIVMPPADNRPDSCRLPQGGDQFYTVLAWRLDGWNGAITVSAEGLPTGVTCPPQVMGAGLKQMPLVVSAATTAPVGIHEFKIKGTAVINGQTVIREARAASISWPTQPQQGIPVISRLDRSFVLAVREQAPFRLTAELDKAFVVQGDKVNLKGKLTRLWPDFKTPLQAIAMDLPPNQLTVNNNQPINFAPGKDEMSAVVDAKAGLAPGTYTIVLRGAAQVPFNKDPMAKQKPNINVMLPSTAVTLTVLPKQVATVTLPNPNLTAKIGAQSEVPIKLTRLHDFAGEFKVQVVLPSNVKGVNVDAITIPAGQNEAKLVLRIDPAMTPVNLANLIVRATAMVNGNVPTVHEVKLNVNVVK
jgi:hypothetical protein